MNEQDTDLFNLMVDMTDAAIELETQPLGTVLGSVASAMAAITRIKENEEAAMAAVGLLEAIESMCHASRFMREIEIENEINDLTSN